MKIGILTFHDGINHGAFLQAYCLFKAVESYGFDVEMIGYKNFKHWVKEYKAFLWCKSPRKLFHNIIKIIKFRANQKKLKCRHLKFNVRKINTSQYDVIIIGSDIVWDYQMKLLGSDPIYFGHGLKPKKKLISYAPSIGTVNTEDHVPEYVKLGLKKFSNLSARDHKTAQLVKDLTGNEVPVVLDPTFLYSVDEEAVKPKMSGYLLVYAYYLEKKEIDEITHFCKKNNLSCVAIGYSQPWSDLNVIDVDVFEWLGYFKNAKYVVTSTFHGLLYSIHFHKTFCVSLTNANKNKASSILGDLGLSNRVLCGDGSVERLLNTKIDYAVINPLIDRHLKMSKEYLLGSLKVEKA
jgi:hypothetical protein